MNTTVHLSGMLLLGASAASKSAHGHAPAREKAGSAVCFVEKQPTRTETLATVSTLNTATITSSAHINRALPVDDVCSNEITPIYQPSQPILCTLYGTTRARSESTLTVHYQHDIIAQDVHDPERYGNWPIEVHFDSCGDLITHREMFPSERPVDYREFSDDEPDYPYTGPEGWLDERMRSNERSNYL